MVLYSCNQNPTLQGGRKVWRRDYWYCTVEDNLPIFFFPQNIKNFNIKTLLQVLLLWIKDQKQSRLLSKTCYHQKTRQERKAMSHANFRLHQVLPSALLPSGHAHHSMNLAYTADTTETATSATHLSLGYIEEQAAFLF